MNIQPIQYGKREAVIAEIIMGDKPLFSDDYHFKIELKDSSTNLIDTLNLTLTKDEYIALGEDKEQRAIALLASEDIVVLPKPEIM